MHVEQVYTKRNNENNSSSKLCKTIYIMMLANYCYLERENDTAFKFHINNSSYFEMRAFLY